MDKIRLLIFISVLGGLIYLGFIYDSDRGVIDDDYIASEPYQQLEEEMKIEQESRASAEQKVQMILHKVIMSEDPGKLELPLRGANSMLAGNSRDWSTLFDLRFKNIGRIKQDSLSVHFVLVQEKKNSDESGLFMATSQRDSLLAYQAIGQFKHSVTERVETQIELKEKGIVTTKVVRRRLYPVEQKNLDTYSYAIVGAGKIERLEN